MLKNKLNKNAKKIDTFIKNYINKQGLSSLISPMKYGVLSGGKKIRSSIILSTGKLYNLQNSNLINICGAVECIHSYSLIHDDLPCMDDDKLRRGKPTTHIKFGEATAVLAGNSLLTLAFEMISDEKYKIKNNYKVLLIKKLAKNKREIQSLSVMGEEIGLLFQLADDFLDIKGSTKSTGKIVNKDKKKGKSTIINLVGYEYAYKYANNLKNKILRNLEKHGKKAEDLNEIINFILDRKH